MSGIVRSMRDRVHLLLMLLVAAPVQVQAQPPAPAPATTTAQAADPLPASGRPRIGLVLGGGGAKGAAHIGVLRVLDELRIPIDCIAGTSMGALVGGTLAAGRSPEEIERDVRAIDWEAAVGNQGRRDRTPINRKLDQIAYANPLEVGVVDSRLSTAGGFISTQAIEQQIRMLVADARLTENFDELPVPFRAVATDMVSGQSVILSEGDLSVAMRASMAIPGVFAPVTTDEQVLADGGLLHNLPIDVAREVCADVVIAVWLETPRATREELGSALSLIARSLDVVIRANEREQIATLTDSDVGIAVQMGDITTSDFDRAADAIDLGRAAAEQSRAALSRYSVSAAEYAAWADAVRRRRVESTYVSEVSIVGLDRVNPEYVASQLEYAVAGKQVTTDELEADADRLFALGDFEQVEYRLTGDSTERVLEVRPLEKSWGPNFFRLNIGASTDGDGDIFGILRADHTRTWINDRGGQWRNTFQVGGMSLVSSRLYQPLDTRQRFFVEPYFSLENERHDIYFDSDRFARYFVRELYTAIDAGVNIGTRAQLRAGIRRGWLEADLDTGIPGFPELDPEIDTALQLRATYDTRNAVGLPTRGTFLSARYVHSEDWWDGEQDYDLIEGVVTQSFSLRGNSLSVMAAGGRALSGDLPVTQDFRLGGIRTFPGLKPGELRGHSYWLAGTTYLWRLIDWQPLFNQALYAGLRFEAGEMHERLDGVDDGTLYGLSGSVSGGTPIGPFTLSLGFVSNGSALIQFTLGRPVSEGSIIDELQ